ncbi:MAG: hypothetical protein JST59_00220 [Actinobacteria bacterium]|nr:hypothetical protein [Actinomycetota bacterium]
MQSELKIKECDKDGANAKTIAKLEFDLAEYLNMEEPIVSVEFEMEKADAKLEADLEFVRNDEAVTELDDKKSARSEETIKSARTEGNPKKKSEVKPPLEKPRNGKEQLSKIEET